MYSVDKNMFTTCLILLDCQAVDKGRVLLSSVLTMRKQPWKSPSFSLTQDASHYAISLKWVAINHVNLRITSSYSFFTLFTEIIFLKITVSLMKQVFNIQIMSGLVLVAIQFFCHKSFLKHFSSSSNGELFDVAFLYWCS